jgi:hypothetical protein
MSRRGRGGGECDRCCEELVILKQVVEDVEDGEGEAHSWSMMREGGREEGTGGRRRGVHSLRARTQARVT